MNTTNTPVTQYTYSQPSGANYSRLTQMIYPNGRVLDYVYNSGLDSDISRVSALADDGGSAAGNLQSYTYLGLNTIVQEADANGVALSYIQQPGDTLASSDGGDQYTGLDRFGRVIDQNYVNTSTGVSTDRFQFAYDRDSNALYENNLLNSSFSELFHANSTASNDDSTAYDNLNRITGFERGTLSASGNNGSTLDTVSSPTGYLPSQSWNYDSLGNITSDTGTRYGNETRTANAQNELTDLNGIADLKPTYDSNGNMTDDGLGNIFIYDAWNRPVTVKESTSVVYTFSYMANSNSASSEDYGSFITTDFYYSADGHEIEDRQGRTVTTQYVWGLGSVNDLVLRDDNSVSGNLGGTGSGLGERIFVQHDVNSNVTALTDPSGNVLERFVYTPYGMSTVYSATWGSASEVYNWVYTFQMGRVEKYLGFKFGARYYDPLLQVWDEADPAQYVDGMDRYQLDSSNPVSYADPSGLIAVAAPGGGYRTYISSDPTVMSPFTVRAGPMVPRGFNDGGATTQPSATDQQYLDDENAYLSRLTMLIGLVRNMLQSCGTSDPEVLRDAQWMAKYSAMALVPYGGAPSLVNGVATGGAGGTGVAVVVNGLKVSGVKVGSKLAAAGQAGAVIGVGANLINGTVAAYKGDTGEAVSDSVLAGGGVYVLWAANPELGIIWGAAALGKLGINACYQHKIGQTNASLCSFAKEAFAKLLMTLPELKARYDEARIGLGN